MTEVLAFLSHILRHSLGAGSPVVHMPSNPEDCLLLVTMKPLVMAAVVTFLPPMELYFLV